MADDERGGIRRMTTTTHTLTSWLLDRIAEDETAARECAEMFPSPWEISDRGWRVRIYAADVPTEDLSSDDNAAMTVRQPVVMEVEPDRRIEDPLWLSERVDHIARHDPARVLAECAAKRSIIALHQDPADVAEAEMGERYPMGYLDAASVAVHHLAAVYADAPGYDAAWAVS